MEEGGGRRNGEPPPAPCGAGRRRRRRNRREDKRRDGGGGGSPDDPRGSRDAEGDAAGGAGGQGGAAAKATPRAGEQSDAGGGGGSGGRGGGLNGEEEGERRRLGALGLGGPPAGRNAGVEPERLGLGRVPPLQQVAAAAEPPGTPGAEDGMAAGDAAGTDSDASGSGGLGDGFAEHNGNTEHKRLDLGGLGGDQVQQGQQQVTGGSPIPIGDGQKDSRFPQDGGPGEQDGQWRGGRDKDQRNNGNGSGLDGAETLFKDELNAHKETATGSPQSGAASIVGGSVQPIREGQGGTDRDQTDVGGGGDPGGEEQALLPRPTFLSDAVLSWTMKDVLNDNFYKDKVERIPDVFERREHFAEVHCQLLLEELRSDLCSFINNPSETQYCKLRSVQPCGSACVYFLDIDLDASDPNDVRCRHIARDYDICLLTSKPLGDSNLDIMTCSLGIAVGIGRNTFYQRSFRVLLPESKDFQPQNTKYVSFLTNIQYKLKISDILSLNDERNHAAIQGVMKLYDKVGKQCNICAASPNGKDILHSLFSSMRCTHQEHVEIVWAPMGSTKGFIARAMKEVFSSKQKVLICLSSALSIPDTLMDLKELSNSIVVLNNSKGLENYAVCNEVFLESRSHKLYCFVTQYEGSLKGMSSLLDLSNFYHYKRCASPLCERCSKKGLLDFSMKSIMKRFNNLIGYLFNCLTFLEKHAISFSLLEEDSTKVGELLKTLKELESLMCNENLKDEYVAAAFELMPGIDASSLDSTYTLAELLNKKRISSVNLMGDLINSVRVPNMKNRDDLDRFCIKHSNIIVTTVDCTLKLHDMEKDQFDILLVLGTNRIKEADLLVTFLHPVKHTILIGDPHHLQPVVRSELCKEAGYGVSIFDKMRKLVPKKVQMLDKQFSMDPMISKFPNNQFYNGVIEDGPNVMLPEYSKEFSIKLPKYCYTDIPSGKTRPTRKLYVNSAAILLYLQSFCKDSINSNRKFTVAVVCISSDEANAIRDLLRSKKEIHAKVHLHVESVDSFQEEYFDLIILSMLVEDTAELVRVTENNLYAVLTSSRHYFWMVGDCNILTGAGGIWKCLVKDATERDCRKPMKFDKLSEAANFFEKIDKDQSTDSVLSNIFTHLLGQELTWEERPYKTKYMLPAVRDQKGQPDTCSFQAILGVVESLLRFLFADLVPQQEFKWTFIVDNFKQKYKIIIDNDFQSEDPSDRGNKRFENALTAFKDLGVMAKNESGSEFWELKTSSHEHVDPKMTEAVTKLLELGNIMVGRFLLSRNFYSLKPGEVYVHDKNMQLFHPKSGLLASHGVIMLGIGRRQTRVKETGKTMYTRHMVMQNSEGDLFGINGIGRVGKKTVLDLYRIKVSDLEAKKLARRGA